jgi:hypothetical protein
MSGVLRVAPWPLAALALAVMAGCGADEGEGAASTIEGKWVFSESAGCATEYPAELEFEEFVYGIPADPDRPAGPLGGGDYRIVDGETIELMAPNDAMIRYTYILSRVELVLDDGAGCRVVYVR